MTASALFINYISNDIFLDISTNFNYFLNHYVWLDFLRSFDWLSGSKLIFLFYLVYEQLIANDALISKSNSLLIIKYIYCPFSSSIT